MKKENETFAPFLVVIYMGIILIGISIITLIYYIPKKNKKSNCEIMLTEYQNAYSEFMKLNPKAAEEFQQLIEKQNIQ